MREFVNAVLADRQKIDILRKKGVSWKEVTKYFDGNPTLKLTPEQAELWNRIGLGIWAERRSKMLVVARVEAFLRPRDLSALVGDYVVMNREQEWVGPFVRAQFLKRETLNERWRPDDAHKK